MSTSVKTVAAEVGVIAAAVQSVLSIISQAASSVHLPAGDQAVITGVSALVGAVLLAAKDLAAAKLAARRTMSEAERIRLAGK